VRKKRKLIVQVLLSHFLIVAESKKQQYGIVSNSLVLLTVLYTHTYTHHYYNITFFIFLCGCVRVLKIVIVYT